MYKITIEKTETVTKMVRGDWGKVNDIEGSDYDYAPDREDEVKTTEKVYEQVVDDLELVRVIDAVNTLPRQWLVPSEKGATIEEVKESLARSMT